MLMRWVIYFVIANGVLVTLVLAALGLTSSFKGQGLSADGWMTLFLGTFITTSLGVGLMALVFDADRADIDDETYRVSSRKER